MFAIYEGNMEKLTKKLNTIRKKCEKYGCTFNFEEVGEEFREVTLENGEKVTTRFILVEAEGVARINGWRFVATVEHTEKGNIINKAFEVGVPERYYTSAPICEHCNSNRYRKDTYIVMNEETGEFKQVGKSCLKDFTGGMSAEGVAYYTSLFEELIQKETPLGMGHIERYFEVKEFLLYVAETIKHFGYVKTQYGMGVYSTRERASDYYMIDNGGNFNFEKRMTLKEEMKSVSFNAQSNKEYVEELLAWVNNQTTNNNYMHNLQTSCNLKYTNYRNLGILASLFPTYNRELEHQVEKVKQEEKNKSEQNSTYIGNVGDRVDVEVTSCECVTSWDTDFGVTRIYKIVDTNGNVYTWKTSKWLEDEVTKIKGTVKEHKEYRGVKQTELTRCKVA